VTLKVQDYAKSPETPSSPQTWQHARRTARRTLRHERLWKQDFGEFDLESRSTTLRLTV
jgi:hypothetical protein